MVKIGGRKKCKLGKKRKLTKNKGKFINFVEIGGIYQFCGNRRNLQYASLTLGMDASALGSAGLMCGSCKQPQSFGARPMYYCQHLHINIFCGTNCTN